MTAARPGTHASSVQESAAIDTRRVGFIDTVRAIALGRVVFGHAANAVGPHVVTTMPLMFFSGGALARASFARGPALPVLRRRLRRALLPIWWYGLIACVVMLVASRVAPGPGTSFSVADALSLALPFRWPTGSEWGYLFVAHLWYIATYLQLFVLTPVLARCYRRAPRLLIGMFIVANVAIHWALTARGWDGRVFGFHIFREVSLALLFVPFWCFGFSYRDGTVQRLSTIARWGLALGFGAAAIVFWRVANFGDGRILMQLVGAAWLFGALAAEPMLERLAKARRLGTVITYVSRRALTIYLWHLVAIWATVELMKSVPSMSEWMLAIAPWWFWRSLGAIVLTFVFCVLFGWIEDVAARRRTTLLLGVQPLEDRPAPLEQQGGGGAASRTAAMFGDEIDRDDRDAVAVGERAQLLEARRRAVVVEHLADHRDGR
jgi:peptidoglycan/LPS O-acetylase OafA/YrhL